jgi:secondary thiamine-phosphate synthase enzyme
VKQAHGRVAVATRGKGLYEITGEVERWVSSTGITAGLLTVYCPHTSASLVIQENADPDVQTDLARYFERAAPEGAEYDHTLEGPDDMPAHIRAALTSTSLSIPVESGRTTLGTWQGIYVFEHRRSPHHRTVILHLLG